MSGRQARVRKEVSVRTREREVGNYQNEKLRNDKCKFQPDPGLKLFKRLRSLCPTN